MEEKYIEKLEISWKIGGETLKATLSLRKQVLSLLRQVHSSVAKLVGLWFFDIALRPTNVETLQAISTTNFYLILLKSSWLRSVKQAY